jgi:hypothetical protein
VSAVEHAPNCPCRFLALLRYTHPSGEVTYEVRFADETSDQWEARIAAKYAKPRGERRSGR